MAHYPDPKAPPRVKDPDVYKRFHAAGHDCLACGNRNVTAAHLLGGNRREDDIRALVPLCGGGSGPGCHGAWHGNPYRGDFGHYFTMAEVKNAVARHLRHEAGDDNRAYLVERLGEEGAEAYIEKLEAA